MADKYRDSLDEISRVQYDNAMARAAAVERASKPAKNEIVDAAGFGRLSESDLHAFAGIEGPAEEARIAWDVPVNIGGEFDACLVLCDAALGLTFNDADDNLHGYQLSDCPRLVRELVAAELLKWAERHPGVAITDDVLDRLGFESVF